MHDVAREEGGGEVCDNGDGGDDGPERSIFDACVRCCVVGAVGEPQGIKGSAVEEDGDSDSEGGGGLEKDGRLDDA